MAGPCSIEGEEHTIKMAKAVKAGGANFLRGGAYKPRTSPYSFQGLGTEGILDLVTMELVERSDDRRGSARLPLLLTVPLPA